MKIDIILAAFHNDEANKAKISKLVQSIIWFLGDISDDFIATDNLESQLGEIESLIKELTQALQQLPNSSESAITALEEIKQIEIAICAQLLTNKKNEDPSICIENYAFISSSLIEVKTLKLLRYLDAASSLNIKINFKEIETIINDMKSEIDRLNASQQKISALLILANASIIFDSLQTAAASKLKEITDDVSISGTGFVASIGRKVQGSLSISSGSPLDIDNESSPSAQTTSIIKNYMKTHSLPNSTEIKLKIGKHFIFFTTPDPDGVTRDRGGNSVKGLSTFSQDEDITAEDILLAEQDPENNIEIIAQKKLR